MELLQVGREELIQEWSVSWNWNRACFLPGKMEKHPRHEDLHPSAKQEEVNKVVKKNGLDDSKTDRAKILTSSECLL